MNGDDLEALLPELEAFHGRFSQFFCRTEGRAWSRKYLTGLALPIERKNVENIAEQVGAPARKLQEFLSDSPWDDAGCIDELRRFVGEQFGATNGVLILDDTGFAKKGKCSAGVGRQYSGTLGRTDNCQIGVFLGYASGCGHTLVDRRLYLTEAWFAPEAAGRRGRAGVPDSLSFKTKLELGAEMLTAVHASGQLAYQWVTGDAAYGESHDLRQTVADQGKWYCFEVRSSALVWASNPNWQVKARPAGRGRPPSRPRPTMASPVAVSVSQLAAELPATAWTRHRVAEGAKGPREYEFARVRVIEKRHRTPGPQSWMMARRPVGSTAAEAKYYLSNAPDTAPLAEVAWVGCLRWTIEENFELAKGEVGLDHYEVTKLRGWYHHITLVLLALAFLKSVQWTWEKKTDHGLGSGDPPASRGRAAAGAVDPGRGHCVVRASASPQGGCTRLSSAALAA